MPRLTQVAEETIATPPGGAAAEAPAAFEALAAALADPARPAAARLNAARRLAEHGPAAAPALAAALGDANLKVRLAAAEALGQVGDARSVAPLIEALRSLFPGKSARRSRLAIWLLLITGVMAVFAVAAVMLVSGDGVGGLLISLLGGLCAAGAARSTGPSLSECCRVMAEALARIAERDPTPELLGATASLREIAADTLQQEPAARAACRAAAERIEALAAAARDLPVAASAPVTEAAEVLPRPAEAPALDPTLLPRAASGEARLRRE